MSDLTDKTCPYCKTKFNPGDQIVICSKCKIPHHQACWVENQACTTHGCTGTIEEGNSEYPSSARHRIPVAGDQVVRSYCTRCGNPSAAGANYCSICGNSLTGPVFPPASPAVFPQEHPNYDEQTEFIGAHAYEYIKNFNRMRIGNTSVTWNWAAFLFAPWWALYRKMYLVGGILLGVHFIIACIGGTYIFYLGLAASIGIGMFGNFFYKNHVEKHLVVAQSLNNEVLRKQYYRDKGGTNLLVPIITLICVLLFNSLIWL